MPSARKKTTPLSAISPWPHYLNPRNWPLLAVFALLRLMILLPFSLQLWLGRRLGALLMHLGGRRRHVARTNIRLCFPELSEAEVEALVRKHFLSLGMSVFEMGMAWWASERRLRGLVSVEGADSVDKGLAGGKGVILLNAHFTTMDIGVRLLITALKPPIYMTYRPHNNPLLDILITANRVGAGEGGMDYSDVRGMIACLKKNKALWYAPDQSYRGKQAALVPFFGIPVSSRVATSRLAKITGAAVVPFFVRRREDNKGYVVTLFPPLEDFPTDDVVTDTARFHHLLEDYIRKAPEQYLWIHRRFKHLAPGEPDVYSQD